MDTRKPSSEWVIFVPGACVLVIVLLVLLSRTASRPLRTSEFTHEAKAGDGGKQGSTAANRPSRRARLATEEPAAPEEIVASKVSQFARSRREVLYQMAQHYGIKVPDDVERFFDAVEGNRWDELEALFNSILKRHQADPPDREVDLLWPAILDTFGAAEQAHIWPAQKLLDYGKEVLGSLRPDMVYIGGTDEGRWVPALLNASDGERHVMITQNQLVAGEYVDYLKFLYGDRIEMLGKEDTRRAYDEYLADYQKRLTHDQQFPNEPKQIRPGESDGIMVNSNGSLGISGPNSRVAVFTINELLVRILMERNPDVSFAVQESYPMKSTYGEAALLGPITELRADTPEGGLTAESAAQSVEYWRGIADQMRGEVDDTPLKAYSKLAVGQANLLANQNLFTQAEETYRIANSIFPGNVEATIGLSDILAQTGRMGEAHQLLQTFIQNYPGQRSAIERSTPWAIVGSP